MSRFVSGSSTRQRGFPRVSGDEPYLYTPAEVDALFSPRERG